MTEYDAFKSLMRAAASSNMRIIAINSRNPLFEFVKQNIDDIQSIYGATVEHSTSTNYPWDNAKERYMIMTEVD
jgi:hypothetical protein